MQQTWAWLCSSVRMTSLRVASAWQREAKTFAGERFCARDERRHWNSGAGPRTCLELLHARRVVWPSGLSSAAVIDRIACGTSEISRWPVGMGRGNVNLLWSTPSGGL